MSQSRLSSALTEGLIALPPTGPRDAVLVLRPPAGADLSALPRDRVRIVTGFRPDADWWEAAGLATAPDGSTTTDAGLAIVVVPRSKALARALVAEAMRAAPVVVIDGQKTDGVDGLWREMRGRVGDLPSITRGHGRIFSVPSSDAFADWTPPEPEAGPDGFVRVPGVFSETGADRGSILLAEALPPKLPARMADLGAGWGYLAAMALRREGVTRIDLIEAERASLDCARVNIPDPRARFHWADATTFRPEEPFDGILCNPPFHVGRAADPGLGRAFIDAAGRMLTPSGALWLVANRHLPYEAALRARFRNVTEIGGDAAFKLFHATRPNR